MQGFLENFASTSIQWAVYFEDGTTQSGDFASGANTVVPPSPSTESWSDVTWIAFTTGGGTVWMAGPASGINAPAVLVAAGPSATQAEIVAGLGNSASGSALISNQTSDSASWTAYSLNGTQQSGSLSAGDTASLTWTGVTWVVFTCGAGVQYMAGPSSGILYAADLIAVSNSATFDDVLAQTAALPR